MEIIPTSQNNGLAIADSRPLDQNPAAVYLAGLKPTGRRSQRQALNVIAEMLGAADCFSLPWGSLRFQHTEALRAKLAENHKPATANRMLCALRQTLRAAWKLGQMSAEDYQRAADVGSVGGSTLPAGRELNPGEISGLLQVCEDDPTAAGARDAAIVALMYSCGLRRDEVANLARENYEPETGKLVIKIAKRSKERTAYLINGAAHAMADWLQIRGAEPGALFCAINKGGKIGGGMTNQAIYNLLAKRAEQAGVKHFSPHDLRRTFVSDLLDAGADISTVAKMAGHASVTTTARYDRRPEEAKRKAAGLLHVPYHGRRLAA
jgi:integrase/recombinase XerD